MQCIHSTSVTLICDKNMNTTSELPGRSGWKFFSDRSAEAFLLHSGVGTDNHCTLYSDDAYMRAVETVSWRRLKETLTVWCKHPTR